MSNHLKTLYTLNEHKKVKEYRTELIFFFFFWSILQFTGGKATVFLDLNQIITLTTLKTGNKGAYPTPPAPTTFPLPYSDNFDGESKTTVLVPMLTLVKPFLSLPICYVFVTIDHCFNNRRFPDQLHKTCIQKCPPMLELDKNQGYSGITYLCYNMIRPLFFFKFFGSLKMLMVFFGVFQATKITKSHFTWHNRQVHLRFSGKETTELCVRWWWIPSFHGANLLETE